MKLETITAEIFHIAKFAFVWLDFQMLPLHMSVSALQSCEFELAITVSA
jgi:hypothetical protein